MEQELIIKALSWLVGILASALGFFLTYYFLSTSKVINSLKEAINSLNVNLTGLNCVAKHKVVDKRLDDHGRRLDEHHGKLIELDTKINYKL